MEFKRDSLIALHMVKKAQVVAIVNLHLNVHKSFVSRAVGHFL